MAQGRDGVISQVAMKGPAVLWGDMLRKRGEPENGWGRRLGPRPEAQVPHSASHISSLSRSLWDQTCCEWIKGNNPAQSPEVAGTRLTFDWLYRLL